MEGVIHRCQVMTIEDDMLTQKRDARQLCEQQMGAATAPPDSYQKINFDGAFIKETRKGALGLCNQGS